MNFQLPTTYSRIPIPPPPGSLGATLADNQDGLQTNLNAIATSIKQTIQALSSLFAAVTAAVARITALEGSAATAVSLTAAGGGSTWALLALTGYPSIRAVIVDTNGESNTLNLPVLSASDRAIFTIKAVSNSGDLSINAGTANIIGLSGGSTSLTIPYATATITTYGLTIIWDGTNWQVIDTAIFVA